MTKILFLIMVVFMADLAAAAEGRAVQGVSLSVPPMTGVLSLDVVLAPIE